MAEMNAAADAWHAVRDHGYCNHGSATGHRNPPVHKVQKLLKPGQLICTAGCGTVFTDEVDYMTQCGDPMANPVPLPGHPAHTPAPATTPAPPEA